MLHVFYTDVLMLSRASLRVDRTGCSISTFPNLEKNIIFRGETGSCHH